MSLEKILAPDAVIPALRVNGKKQALQELSERAADVAKLPAREIFDAILQRERLGPTGVGDGIAIPHGKLPRCERICGVFARLERPIDFEALGRLAGPPDLSADRARGGGSRPSQGAGGYRPATSPARHRRAIARRARGLGDLFAADHVARLDRGPS